MKLALPSISDTTGTETRLREHNDLKPNVYYSEGYRTEY